MTVAWTWPPMCIQFVSVSTSSCSVTRQGDPLTRFYKSKPHLLNILSHKYSPRLGHGTDFFLRFLNRDCAKNYRYVRFSHYAHVILHIEKPRKNITSKVNSSKKRTRQASLIPLLFTFFDISKFKDISVRAIHSLRWVFNTHSWK